MADSHGRLHVDLRRSVGMADGRVDLDGRLILMRDDPGLTQVPVATLEGPTWRMRLIPGDQPLLERLPVILMPLTARFLALAPVASAAAVDGNDEAVGRLSAILCSLRLTMVMDHFGGQIIGLHLARGAFSVDGQSVLLRHPLFGASFENVSDIEVKLPEAIGLGSRGTPIEDILAPTRMQLYDHVRTEARELLESCPADIA